MKNKTLYVPLQPFTPCNSIYSCHFVCHLFFFFFLWQGWGVGIWVVILTLGSPIGWALIGLKTIMLNPSPLLVTGSEIQALSHQDRVFPFTWAWADTELLSHCHGPAQAREIQREICWEGRGGVVPLKRWDPEQLEPVWGVSRGGRARRIQETESWASR